MRIVSSWEPGWSPAVPLQLSLTLPSRQRFSLLELLFHVQNGRGLPGSRWQGSGQPVGSGQAHGLWESVLQWSCLLVAQVPARKGAFVAPTWKWHLFNCFIKQQSFIHHPDIFFKMTKFSKKKKSEMLSKSKLSYLFKGIDYMYFTPVNTK